MRWSNVREVVLQMFCTATTDFGGVFNFWEYLLGHGKNVSKKTKTRQKLTSRRRVGWREEGKEAYIDTAYHRLVTNKLICLADETHTHWDLNLTPPLHTHRVMLKNTPHITIIMKVPIKIIIKNNNKGNHALRICMVTMVFRVHCPVNLKRLPAGRIPFLAPFGSGSDT